MNQIQCKSCEAVNDKPSKSGNCPTCHSEFWVEKRLAVEKGLKTDKQGRYLDDSGNIHLSESGEVVFSR